MLSKAQIKWFYICAIAFIGILAVSFYFEFFFMALLPLIPVFFYLLFAHTDKVIYFLAFAAPLSIPIKDVGGGFGIILPTEPLIMMLFAGFLFKMVMGQGLNRNVLKSPITVLVLLNMFWLYVTTATSTMPFISFKYSLSYTWYVFVFVFVLIHFFKNPKAMKIFLWCFSLGTLILVMYTLKKHGDEGFSRLYAYTASRPFIPDHGMYAAAITFCIPVMFIIGVFGRRMKLNWFGVAMAMFVFTIVTLGVIFSFTRASWLSLVLAFGVFGLLFLRIQFKTLVTTGLVIIGLLLMFQNVILTELSRNKQGSTDDLQGHVESFSNVSTDPSNLERLNRWSSVYRMFGERPIFGHGPGTYTFKYAPYQISSEMTIISTNSGDLGNVHSEYLRPFAESGLLGGLFFFILVLVVIQQGFYVYYHAKDVEIRILAMAVLLGLITYFAHAFLNNYSEFDKIAVPMWSMISMIVAMRVYHMHRSSQV
ncbi:MAG: putative inorganic carbon (HCO3(-)) transporter [Bacteroidia bacterium]